mmetsp:Transcript_142634/g.263062  ORF Transcript_142634/g.263062 Transcript_142634/m.263062 type:complete len:796 (-) Transcript_142634:60-2447(-)
MEEPDAKRARLEGNFPPGAPAISDLAGAGSEDNVEIHIPQQYVGWMKGSQGRQIKDIEIRSGAQVNIDQSTKELGYSRAVISGQPAAVAAACDLINSELARVTDRDGLISAPAEIGEAVGEVQIPQKYVGWLKGSGGGQLRDMESKSGAQVKIDQSTREAGYSIAHITGNEQAVQICKGLMEAELARVQERDRVVEQHKAIPELHGNTGEVRIPQQYVGWIKGAGGAQIKDIEGRTGACVTIDQSSQDKGYSRAMVYGEPDRVHMAVSIIQAELSRVMERDSVPAGPAAAVGFVAEVPQATASTNGMPSLSLTGVDSAVNIVGALKDTLSAAISSGQASQNPLQLLTTLLTAAAKANSSPGSVAVPQAPAPALAIPASTTTHALAVSDPSDTGEWDIVRIPSSCVGWLKGKRGAMIREIETRSGAVVDVDQTNKDRGYSVAQIRGPVPQKKIAFGLVVSEVMKAMDSSGEMEDFPLGHKHEFRVDTQFVGWIKGPKGKVVQDIQVKSATRIDVDQSSGLGTAAVRIYGTPDGVTQARQLLASELSKVSPETAVLVAGDLPFEQKTASRERGIAFADQAAVAASTSAAVTSSLSPLLGYQGATMGSMPTGVAPSPTYDLSALLGQQQQPQQAVVQHVAYAQPAPALQATASYVQPQPQPQPQPQSQQQQQMQQALAQVHHQAAAVGATLQQMGFQLQQPQQQPPQLAVAGALAGHYGQPALQQPQLQAQPQLQLQPQLQPQPQQLTAAAPTAALPAAAPLTPDAGAQALQLAQALQQIVNTVQNVVAASTAAATGQ